MNDREFVSPSNRAGDTASTIIDTFSLSVFVAATLLVGTLLVCSVPSVAGTADRGLTSNLGESQSSQCALGTNLSQENGSNPATTVSFNNQTTNGSTVTVSSVTLPEPGYVALHTDGYATGPAPAEYSIIAVSPRLSAGHHENVTIDVSNAPPGNPPGVNLSRLNSSETLAATVYQDTNGNQQFDFVESTGSDDGPFIISGDVVSDIARVTVPTSPPRTASVTFRNQTLRNNTVTVAQARLPRGGFLIAQNASFRRSGDAVTSAVGLSRYLPPGNYTNVSVRLLPGALDESQVVTIRPSLDTNGNHQYDYITSNGFRDVAYENNSKVVTAPAVVRVPRSQQATRTSAEAQTQARTTGTTVSSSTHVGTITGPQTGPSIQTGATTPTSSTSSATTSPQDRNAGSGAGGFLDRLGTGGVIAILLGIAAVALLIIWRVQ